MRALAGIWKPARGVVRLDGARLDQWNGDARGDFIGYLPQQVELFDGTVAQNIAIAQLRVNIADRSQSLAPAAGRRTTNSLHPAKGLWVYGRGGLPCRRCGAQIQSRKSGADARLTYWCPACQRLP